MESEQGHAGDRVFRVPIAASPEAAWHALTDPETVRRWYFDTAIRSDWVVGHDVEYVDERGVVHLNGELLSYDPPRSFSHRFLAHWGQQPDDQGTMTWSVEPADVGCVVTLIHSGGSGEETRDGDDRLTRALKALLESGAAAAELGRRYIEAVGAHDLDAVRALLADDLVARFADGVLDKEEWMRALARLLPALERNDRIRVFASATEAAVVYDFVTRTPAGAVRCVELVRAAEGRITEVELLLDRVAFAPVNDWLAHPPAE